MASDQLRKKWGTIFMGEREATPQQLDAMQEPLLRERAQQQQQEDYLARVRARAEERAREILGAAYAERQKVLEEAGAEAQSRILQLTREAQALRAQTQEELAQAEAERGKARDLREEAENIRDHAHNEGFQAGMEQAGEELKEFRADVGQMLGNLLRALEAQRRSLGEAWRDELAELARVAVEAGTGWILQAEHQRILQSLVLSSIQLLEDRATVTVRVHPDDEASVGDLFRAARERVPELSQWIVNGDSSVEAGGLVAESVSGSVENLREYYREMVNGILEYLTLPPRPEEEQAGEAVSAVLERESAHLAQVVPDAAPAAEPLPVELAESVNEADTAEPAAESGSDFAPATETEQAVPDVQEGMESGPEAALLAPDMPVGADAAPAYEDQLPAGGQGQDVAVEHQDALNASADAQDAASQAVPDAVQEPLAEPPANAGGEEFSGVAPTPSAQPAQGTAVQPEHADEVQPAPADETQPEEAHTAPVSAEHNANPSLAELEDELFPLPDEEKDDASQTSSSVFVSGGFLPGSDNGQPG